MRLSITLKTFVSEIKLEKDNSIWLTEIRCINQEKVKLFDFTLQGSKSLDVEESGFIYLLCLLTYKLLMEGHIPVHQSYGTSSFDQKQNRFG